MKVLYTATVLSHICQFHLPYLKKLQEHGHIIHVAAHDNLSQKNGLKLSYSNHFEEIPFHRSPFSKNNISAFKRLKRMINQERYNVIVCNTPVGGILTRLASCGQRSAGARVIYIAHGFHFFKGAPIKNWLLYYPIEKIMAHFCDLIVTVNQEDYNFAKKNLSTKVEHIHGVGVSSKRFHTVTVAEKNALRKKEGLEESDFVVLCTGELNKNKDQKTLIKAVAILNGKIPNLKILFAGNGPLEKKLRAQVEELNLLHYVTFLGYRTDMEKIIATADVVVSCSHREGMPLNIIEAMMCGKPIIAAENRGTLELVLDNVNGYLFAKENHYQLAALLNNLFNNNNGEMLGDKGKVLSNKYTIDAVQEKLINLIEG